MLRKYILCEPKETLKKEKRKKPKQSDHKVQTLSIVSSETNFFVRPQKPKKKGKKKKET